MSDPSPALMLAIEEWREQGRAEVRTRVLEWADDAMQALPERRTPVAHGKAELLTEIRSLLNGGA